ncbi:hypothetical protein [Lyngbya sp. CCY1209]|uniref:hypothetical protein n=1 Tax=Lyngbya sp. CCY1209 TaxID=2886103 RepID=UPI002D20D244|nr:hypothetical protein [Lyngbya sp. CCY1209]MEB3887102.1 hypothetical protein [Lyngbya sp. CCY1209]
MYWVTLTAAVAYAFGIYLLLLMLQRLLLRKPAPQSQLKPSFVLRTNFLRRAIR